MIRGDSYKVQKEKPFIKPGAVVIVQAGKMVTKPYLCYVIERECNWVDGKRLELCTTIPFQHSAVIWEYWAHRISKANTWQSLWFKLWCTFEKLYKTIR